MPVNSFWMSGTGDALSCRPQAGPTPVFFALSRCAQAQLEPQRSAPALSRREREKVSVPRGLAEAVFKEDWLAYQQAWQALDAGEIAALLARQQAGETVRLTLCGERNALTFETRAATLKTRISRIFNPLRMLDVLERL